MDRALEVLNTTLTDRRAKIAPDMEEDDFFELFAAEQFLRHSRLEVATIEDGLVGDGDDGGIDGSYLFVNGRWITGDLSPEDLEGFKKNVEVDWIILQAGREASFKEDVLPKIQDTLEDTFKTGLDRKALRQTYNAEVVDAIERFRFVRRHLAIVQAAIHVHICYATKGEYLGR